MATKLKKYDFCEASATFQDTHQMLRLPRYLHVCHVGARPCHCDSSKQQHLRHVTLNAAPATTSRKATSQSAVPATKKRRACFDTLPKYCACHAKRENDLPVCDLVAPKSAFRARLPPLFILWRKGLCRSARVPTNEGKLTSWRRVGDELKRRRTRREHRSNPRPQL